MMQPKTIYVPIDVKERLPEKSGAYPCIQYGEHHNRFFDGKRFSTVTGVTHWLEKQEMVVVKQNEYDNIICKAKNDGYKEGYQDGKDEHY